MRTLVLGYVRRSGKSKASGAPFDFAQLICAQPVEQVVGERFSAAGEGFQPMEVSLENGREGQFKGLKFPLVLELTMEVKPGRGGEVQAVCTGFVQAKAS